MNNETLWRTVTVKKINKCQMKMQPAYFCIACPLTFIKIEHQAGLPVIFQ